ncbi:MAG: hypothetical protein RPS47_05430 [Colwellia sp.]
MAKLTSPVWLQEELMQAAASTAKRFDRSPTEQVEYWANLGRSVSSILDPDALLSVASGLASIKVEPVFSAPIDAGSVFQTLENDRESAMLSAAVTTSTVRYQVSLKQLGYLERIDPDNNITIGLFENGQFIESNGLES